MKTKNTLSAERKLGRVLYVGPDELLFSMIESHLLEEFEFQSLAVSSGKALLSKELRDSADLCFVSAAALGNSSDIVSFCMALREAKPDLPTILCSAEVAMSDFSTERWEMCDATLRIPLSRVATVLSVSAALENNAGFVQKCIQTGRWRDPDEHLDPAAADVTEQLAQQLNGSAA